MNDERICCDKYRLSWKKLPFIDINIKRGEQNTSVILYVDILITVKILVYECILYDKYIYKIFILWMSVDWCFVNM